MNHDDSTNVMYSCSLCDRTRAQVVYLIVGSSGAVCSDCVMAARALMETINLSRPTLFQWLSAWRRLTFAGPTEGTLSRLRKQLESELEQQSVECSFAISTPLVRAACELWDFNVDACRRLAEHARRLRNSQARLDALSHIPEAARLSGDRVAMSVAAWELGDFERGLHALESGGWTDPLDELFSHLNRATLTMEIWRNSNTSDKSPDLLHGVTKELDHARQLLSEALPSADDRRAKCEELINVNAAYYEFLCGDPSSAKGILMAALTRVPDLHPYAYLGLGDVHAALGENDDATRMWRTALEKLHPESRVAREVHTRLERLGSSSNGVSSTIADSGE